MPLGPSACRPGIDAACRIIVKVFPFFASEMPVTKKGNPVHNLSTCNPFVFNRLWRAWLPQKAQSAPGSARLPLTSIMSKPRAKNPSKCCPQIRLRRSCPGLFITQDFHGKQPCRRTRWKNSGSNGDSHRNDGNPKAVENTRVKRDVRYRVNLRIERDEVVGSGYSRK